MKYSLLRKRSISNINDDGSEAGVRAVFLWPSETSDALTI